jgi:hypothetical protein
LPTLYHCVQLAAIAKWRVAVFTGRNRDRLIVLNHHCETAAVVSFSQKNPSCYGLSSPDSVAFQQLDGVQMKMHGDWFARLFPTEEPSCLPALKASV